MAAYLFAVDFLDGIKASDGLQTVLLAAVMWFVRQVIAEAKKTREMLDARAAEAILKAEAIAELERARAKEAVEKEESRTAMIHEESKRDREMYRAVQTELLEEMQKQQDQLAELTVIVKDALRWNDHERRKGGSA